MYSDSIEKAREIAYKLRSNPNDTFEITFQITSECNFRCTYCYEHKTNKSLSLEQCCHVIDQFFPIEDHLDYFNGFLLGEYNKNHFSFNFFGGECFLEIDKMIAIVDYFFKKCDEDPERYAERKKNFKFVCQTNGSLIRTPKAIQFLDKYNDIMSMFITIDGCKKFHDKCRIFKDTGEGTWDIVSENIKWYMNRYNRIPSTKGTISPETLPYLYESYLAYKDLGFKTINCTIRNDVIWSEEDKEEAKKQYRLIVNDLLTEPKEIHKWATFSSFDDVKSRRTHLINVGSCHSNGTGFCLCPDNNIYLCFNFSPVSIPEFLGRESMAIGTIADGITEKGIKIQNEVQHMVDKYHFEHDKCKNCTIAFACEFCPATNYLTNGNINKDNKNACEMRIIERQASLYYYYMREKLYGDIPKLEEEIINERENINKTCH